MGKIVVLFLCLFSTISCINGSSLSLQSPSNPNPRESENVEEKMEELENFHAEFKDFKSSLVELSAAFRRFHQSVAAVVNGSSAKTEPEPEKPDSQSITSCSVAMETLSSPLSKKQTIYPYGNGNSTSLKVLCDFETDGGGWTLIQKRTSGPQQEFNRTWNDYANVFGLRAGNFWLGLDNIHALTKDGDQELRIDLEDFEGNKRHAKYSSFSISDASDFYRLSISGYSGDAGNDMVHSSESSWVHNGMQFSTKDKDNDKDSGGHCAVTFPGGWWFNRCFAANLNGVYREKGETVPNYQGIIWNSWKGFSYSLAKTEMKIRQRK